MSKTFKILASLFVLIIVFIFVFDLEVDKHSYYINRCVEKGLKAADFNTK